MMIARIALLTALLAAPFASANIERRGEIAKRALFSITATDAAQTSCVRAYTSLAAGVPTPTGELSSWAATVSEPTVTVTALEQVCSTSFSGAVTPPASLTSAYSEYSSEVMAWASSESSLAASLANACGGQMSVLFEILVATDVDECTSLAKEFSTIKPSGTQAFATDTKNAAVGPRETGAVAAAVAAVAGVVGVIAAL